MGVFRAIVHLLRNNVSRTPLASKGFFPSITIMLACAIYGYSMVLTGNAMVKKKNELNLIILECRGISLNPRAATVEEYRFLWNFTQVWQCRSALKAMQTTDRVVKKISFQNLELTYT